MNDLKLRPALHRFAQEMESTLREKDTQKGKAGWREGQFPGGVPRLAEMLSRNHHHLMVAVGRSDYNEIEHKAIDIANLAMMVSDYLKGPAK